MEGWRGAFIQKCRQAIYDLCPEELDKIDDGAKPQHRSPFEEQDALARYYGVWFARLWERLETQYAAEPAYYSQDPKPNTPKEAPKKEETPGKPIVTDPELLALAARIAEQEQRDPNKESKGIQYLIAKLRDQYLVREQFLASLDKQKPRHDSS